MIEIQQELLVIAENLDRFVKREQSRSIKQPLAELKRSAEAIARSWSGSWIGDHARIYYRDFQPPPSGARFSQEWGLMRVPFNETVGDWVLYEAGYVSEEIFKRAGNPDVDLINEFQVDATEAFARQKLSALSVLEVASQDRHDDFILGIKERIESLSLISLEEEVNRWSPKVRETKDRASLAQSNQIVPPHIQILSHAAIISHMLATVESLASLTHQARSHIHRLQHVSRKEGSQLLTGSKVFVGHGRSSAWLELERFLRNRLGLAVDEFNRVSPAGIPTVERLAAMLDEAIFAFLVMTGEDEQAAGNFNPRINVVHEAGLFQGRLGFKRAIVVLEEGWEEFSNIAGLGQIRFPKGNIAATFEEIRMVLEREDMLSVPNQDASG